MEVTFNSNYGRIILFITFRLDKGGMRKTLKAFMLHVSFGNACTSRGCKYFPRFEEGVLARPSRGREQGDHKQASCENALLSPLERVRPGVINIIQARTSRGSERESNCKTNQLSETRPSRGRGFLNRKFGSLELSNSLDVKRQKPPSRNNSQLKIMLILRLFQKSPFENRRVQK